MLLILQHKFIAVFVHKGGVTRVVISIVGVSGNGCIRSGVRGAVIVYSYNSSDIVVVYRKRDIFYAVINLPVRIFFAIVPVMPLQAEHGFGMTGFLNVFFTCHNIIVFKSE